MRDRLPERKRMGRQLRLELSGQNNTEQTNHKPENDKGSSKSGPIPATVIRRSPTPASPTPASPFDPDLTFADLLALATNVEQGEGIPTPILAQIRYVLQTDPHFASNRDLQTVFIDDRIAAWRFALPETDTCATRVDATINCLYGRYNKKGQNGLALLLEVLADTIPSGDASKEKLEQLAKAVQTIADKQHSAWQNAGRARRALDSTTPQSIQFILQLADIREPGHKRMLLYTLQSQLGAKIEILCEKLSSLHLQMPTPAAHELWNLYAVNAPLIQDLYIAEMCLVTELNQFTQTIAEQTAQANWPLTT